MTIVISRMRYVSDTQSCIVRIENADNNIDIDSTTTQLSSGDCSSHFQALLGYEYSQAESCTASLIEETKPLVISFRDLFTAFLGTEIILFVAVITMRLLKQLRPI